MKLTNKEKKQFLIAGLIVFVLLILYTRSGKKLALGGSKSYIIYGSETCPWTVKALDLGRAKGHNFEFVDCKAGKCPSFVNGFPTYKNNSSGKIHSGFHEDPHSI